MGVMIGMSWGTAIPVTIEDDTRCVEATSDNDDSALAYVRRRLPEAANRRPRASTAELEARLWRRWRSRRGAHRARDYGAQPPQQQRNFGEWSDRGDSSDGGGSSDDGRASDADGGSGRPLPIVICDTDDSPRSAPPANAVGGREGRAMWARRRWTRVPEGRSIWSRVAVAIDVPINIEPCDDIELELLDTTEHFETLPSLPRTTSDPENVARAATLASKRRRQRRSVAGPRPS